MHTNAEMYFHWFMLGKIRWLVFHGQMKLYSDICGELRYANANCVARIGSGVFILGFSLSFTIDI